MDACYRSGCIFWSAPQPGSSYQSWNKRDQDCNAARHPKNWFSLIFRKQRSRAHIYFICTCSLHSRRRLSTSSCGSFTGAVWLPARDWPSFVRWACWCTAFQKSLPLPDWRSHFVNHHHLRYPQCLLLQIPFLRCRWLLAKETGGAQLFKTLLITWIVRCHVCPWMAAVR